MTSNSSPTLENIIFNDNQAYNSGGGLYNSSGCNTKLTNVTFTGNYAGDYGGGMYNTDNSPLLSNVTFSNNRAFIGGGMYNIYSNNLTLTNIIFNDNWADFEGGGINNIDSNMKLTYATFLNNNANGFGGGGGISNIEGNLILTNATFIQNHGEDGGGIYNFNSNALLTNVTFKDNWAQYGGGMASYGGTTTLINGTFSDNMAYQIGGGIAGTSGSNLIIRNTIIWGNTALTAAPQISINGSAADVSDSIVDSGYTGGTNIITTDPLLGPFGNHGGFTETISLLAGSSAIDTGNDLFCPQKDQRDLVRPQGIQCDIGSYEYDLAPQVNSSVRINPNPTGLGSIAFRVTFNEPVTGVDKTDFLLDINGVMSATITNIDNLSDTYIVTVNVDSGYGTIRLDVIDNDSIKDAMDNLLGGTDMGNGSYNSGEVYTINKNPTFADVPITHPYYADIEILYANGLTGGCTTSPLKFCPDQTMNRGQAAVFILRGNFGNTFVPDPATHIFKDDWTKGTWAEPWAEAMRNKGLSAGCSILSPEILPLGPDPA